MPRTRKLEYEILNIDELLNDKTRIDWKEVKRGSIIKTKHEKYGLNDFEFIKYVRPVLYLMYEGIEKTISVSDFRQGRICQLAGNWNKDFQYEIGQEVNGIIITERFKTDRKRYRYKCAKCGFDCGAHYNNGEKNEEFNITEAALKAGAGCSCCCNQITVCDINSISVIDPWMLDFLKNKEDGLKYTHGAKKEVMCKCPDCKRECLMNVYNIWRYRSISCSCGDGVSYPEKVMTFLLEELGVKFKRQLSKTTFEWCEDRYYDFYLTDYNCIVEVNGAQHYRNNTGFATTLEYQILNDKHKKDIALANGIDKYIIINCSISKLDFIKNEIFKSELASMFNLTNIKWDEIDRKTFANEDIKICKAWKDKKEFETVTDISKKLNISTTRLQRVLNKGTSYGWCYYDGKEEQRKNGAKNGSNMGKPVYVYDLKGNLLYEFPSAKKLEESSVEIFGTILYRSAICNALKSGKPYKNYIFKLIK